MLKRITHVNVWLRDQDEALEFYTQKLRPGGAPGRHVGGDGWLS